VKEDITLLLRYLMLALLVLTMFQVGCDSGTPPEKATTAPSPLPSIEPREIIAEAEQKLQESAYGISGRLGARAAAADFVKTELPKWTLKGMSAVPSDWNVYWIDVEIEQGSEKKILSLIAKPFFPEQGSSYWKAFPLDKNHATQMHEADDSRIKSELNRCKDGS
jgi:hypothetical protein